MGFEDAIAAAVATITDAGVSITYHRGSESVALSAAVGRTIFELVDESGMVTRVESRDYLVAADDLILGGAQVIPQRGDLIYETVGQEVRVHELLSPGGEPAWRYSDRYRTMLRIHTKYVRTE